MRRQKKRFQIVLAVLFLVVLISLGVTRRAQAQGIVYGEEVPAGETVEKDVLLYGDTVRVEGTVDGDVLAIGTNVVIDGDVTGSVVLIGGEAIISGEIEGSAYVAAGTLTLIGDAEIGRSLYAVTANLALRDGAVIQRDLFGISLGANLSGSIGRDTRMIIGVFEIGRILLDAINVSATGQTLDEVLFLPGRAQPATQTGGALFSMLAQEEEEETAADNSNPTTEWLAEQGVRLVSYLIVGLLLLWLRPLYLKRWSTALRQRPLAAAGFGLVMHIIGFVGAMLLLIVIITAGIGLLLLNLSELGWTFLGISLSGLGLAFFTFILFVAFISKIIVAFLVGELILERLYPRGNQFRLWPFLLGLVIYLLVFALPYLGWAIGIIVTLLGLGAVGIVFLARRSPELSPLDLEPAGG